MSQNLQNFVKFQKFQLENLVDFEKCCKTHIFLQKSEPVQPKTSNSLPKFCQPERARQKFAKFSKNAVSKNAFSKNASPGADEVEAVLVQERAEARRVRAPAERDRLDGPMRSENRTKNPKRE